MPNIASYVTTKRLSLTIFFKNVFLICERYVHRCERINNIWLVGSIVGSLIVQFEFKNHNDEVKVKLLFSKRIIIKIDFFGNLNSEKNV